eukprot:5287884-Pleurochrysis_carterae.AAC.3
MRACVRAIACVRAYVCAFLRASGRVKPNGRAVPRACGSSSADACGSDNIHGSLVYTYVLARNAASI